MGDLKLIIIQILSFTAFFILQGLAMLVIENLRPVQKIDHIKKEFWRDTSYAYFSTFLTAPLIAFLSVFLAAYLLAPLFPFQIFDADIQALPFWLQVVLGLFIIDLCVYIRHRFMHINLWQVHAIHHSPDEINWLTHYRIHPIEQIIAGVINTTALHIVGFGGEGIIYAQMIMTGVDIFNHANIRLRFPSPLCYILASPDYHKWHHAAILQAKDKNFAVVFPIIDLIFNSCYFPSGLPNAVGFINENKSSRIFPDKFLKQLTYPFGRRS
jgi:sterol desaturase/sphingolipid hydroxylase (fatty acid hydroxylase superfamily)